MKKVACIFLFVLLTIPSSTVKAQEPFIGEIRLFAGNFAPRGWAFCEGQLLAIAQNSALFSLLGTTYGGDGRTTFALPDLRGRTPVHVGSGPGLQTINWGDKGGVESLSLIQISEGKGDSKSVVGVGSENVRSKDNRNPYLGLHYIIALQGIYPSRN